MIQLCFGDSVKGTLTCAPHIGNTIGGATAVVISTDKPLDTPLQKAAFAVYRTLAAPFYKRRAQKQEARRRAEADPVDYESNHVIALLGGSASPRTATQPERMPTWSRTGRPAKKTCKPC